MLDSTPHLQGMMSDITDRNQAGCDLHESEAKYRLLFENMLEGFASCRMIFDDDGCPNDFVYLDVNRAFGVLTGLRDVVGKRASELLPGIRELNPDLLGLYGRVARTGRPEQCESFVTPLGIWFSISVYSVEKGCFIAVFNNITARKNFEAPQDATIELLRICNEAKDLREFMRRTAGFFQQLTDCEAVGIRLKDGDDFPYFETRGFPDDFVKIERSLCAYDLQGEMIRDEAGHPVLDCMCGNIICGRLDTAKPFFTSRGSFWSSCTSELLANTAETDRQVKTRNRCNSDGYESVALLPLRSHGEAYGLIQFNDRRTGHFTAEKIAMYENLVDYIAIALSKLKTEEELEENELKFRTLADSGQALIWLSGTDKLCNYFNKPWLHFTGRTLEQELGNGWTEGVHPDDFDSCLQQYLTAFDKREKFSIEYRLRHADGDYRWLQDDGMPRFDRNGSFIGYIGHCLDITTRKQSAEEQRMLQEQLYQSQKMEAVGHLASGVAHDFNNILTVISGYCSLLKMDMNKNSPDFLKVNEIAQAAERAATLTHSLLAFSRKQIMNLQNSDLNKVVTKVDKMLRRIIGEDIHLQVTISSDPLHVIIDDLQIEQVLINLAVNARDAMPKGGELTISTKYGETVEESMTTDYPCDSGCYAILTVTDSGVGIDGEIQKRIFEPFFTTKELGRGTGLGLSIVYGIVKQHGGYIYVSSEPGRGTTFRMYLPLVAAGHNIVAEKIIHGDVLPSGDETILVAEDEEPVRNMLKATLVKYGYKVILAVDGQDAIDQFEANKKDIKLVVMDVIMFWLIVNRTFGLFVINHHERRKVHAKEAS